MILAPRRRTVAAALRMMGPAMTGASPDATTSWAATRVLLTPLIEHLGCGDGELVFATDETPERRGGKRTKALGIFRDAVRSRGRAAHPASLPDLA